MNKYFYDDIFISIELGRQSASTGRATSSNGHIWNRCLFSYSTSSSHGYNVTVIINSKNSHLMMTSYDCLVTVKAVV